MKKIKTQIELNKEFNRLPIKEKRIRIAKDVLEQIKSKKLIASRSHNYMSIDSELEEKYDSMQDFMKADEGVCKVCAMGAVLMSKASIANDCEMMIAEDDYIIGNLKGIFTLRQLRLMEIAFEGDFVTCDIDVESTAGERAMNFFSDYSDSEYRLVEIMKNVIKNGSFKP